MAEKMTQKKFDVLVAKRMYEAFEKYMPAIIDEDIVYGKFLHKVVEGMRNVRKDTGGETS